ncbi:hypothetical protein PT974_07166 [Cladobotryum mycophilum]|uniref:Protein LOT5 n=1 Tax=Cladobotryum mycophilum TaxID=491253 RepID=A0ABR0SNI9_9HYPO
MLPTTIRSPPSVADYVPLAEYQSQTPESFTDGKPILHLYITGAKASIPRSQCGTLAVFPADAAGTASTEGQTGGDESAEELIEQTIDIFVTSENFTIFSKQTESGVSIPYPSISIHAIKQINGSQAIWMQLDFADGGADDDDFQTLYESISNCSDLHPDPNNGEEDDEDEYDRIVFEGGAEHEAIEGFSGVLRGAEDGSLPPPMPGSGGWITADNLHEYFDTEGNWIGEEEAEELGEGAGRTRPRDELEKDGVNGHDQDEDPENKRPRVD